MLDFGAVSSQLLIIFAAMIKNPIVKNLIWGLVFVAVVFLGVDLFLHIFTQHNVMVQVPDMVGRSMSESRELVRDDELELVITDSVYVNRVPKGAVYSQNPKAGDKVKKGRKIYLTVNASQDKQTRLPDLVGLSLRQAKVELQSRSLKLGRLIYVGDIATNNVLAQSVGDSEADPGIYLPSGTVVDLKLGLNPEDGYTEVADFRGKRWLKAIDEVSDNSLNLDRAVCDETISSESDTLAAFVYRQVPAPGAKHVVLGTAVRLYFTLDKEKLPVNDSTFKAPAYL